VLRLLSSVAAALLLLVAFATGASAAEQSKAVLVGAFELPATNGYGIFGLFATDGEGGGTLELFVSKKGAGATYVAHGEATTETAHFDLGPLGEVDLTAEKTGRMETVKPACGKPVKVEKIEFVGTIDFHGEEGFTDVEATRTPMRWRTVLSFVCGGISSETVGGDGLPGAELKVKRKDGHTLKLQQNRPGSHVLYQATEIEKEGRIRIRRSVSGRLGGGALTYTPSLGAAKFTPGGPFSGTGSYTGLSLPHEARPGEGTWRGSLAVDFPGRAHVRLAGPGFKASIQHSLHHGSFL
jgi:hypothetical protein